MPLTDRSNSMKAHLASPPNSKFGTSGSSLRHLEDDVDEETAFALELAIIVLVAKRALGTTQKYAEFPTRCRSTRPARRRQTDVFSLLFLVMVNSILFSANSGEDC